MKPFRYLIDIAYVVPALREHAAWPKFNRRKIAIAAAVLLAHGGLVWALINMKAKEKPPIELIETQVILEQVTEDNPIPTPIPPSPQVQKRLQEKIKAQEQKFEQQVRHVNDKAVNTVEAKSDAPKVPEPTPTPVVNETPKPAFTPADAPAFAAKSAEATPQPKSNAPASKGGCGEVSSLRFSSDKAERNQRLKIEVTRGAGRRPMSVNVTSGSAALNADIQRKAMSRLRFVKEGPECEGVTASLTVQIIGADE